MKKYRINTTISHKHHELLKKHAEKFGTQQSVLEYALENMENNNNQSSESSPEKDLWMRLYNIKELLCLVMVDYTKILFDTADINAVMKYTLNEKPLEFAIEWYYNKPLKECSLQELIDGIILNLKMKSPTFIDHADGGDHYWINVMHDIGLNGSKTFVILNESVLKSYGAQFESHYSVRSVYFKIYKDLDGELAEK